MNEKLDSGYVARTKSPRANTIDCRVVLKSGLFKYRLNLSFFQIPEELSGWNISGITSFGKEYLVTSYCKAFPLAVFNNDGSFSRMISPAADLIHPHASFVSDDGSEILVTDSSSHVVWFLSANGDLVFVMGKPGVKSDSGIDSVAWEIDRKNAYLSVRRTAEPFCFPTKALIGPDDRIYVADGHGNSAVHIFSRDGNLIGTFGKPGFEEGAFNTPHSLCFFNGTLCVADSNNDRISFFTYNGEHLSDINGLLYPVDLTSDGEYLYVLEKDGRISIFDGSLNSVGQIGYCGSPFSGTSLFVDNEKNIYLTMGRKPYPILKLEVIG